MTLNELLNPTKEMQQRLYVASIPTFITHFRNKPLSYIHNEKVITVGFIEQQVKTRKSEPEYPDEVDLDDNDPKLLHLLGYIDEQIMILEKNNISEHIIYVGDFKNHAPISVYIFDQNKDTKIFMTTFSESPKHTSHYLELLKDIEAHAISVVKGELQNNKPDPDIAHLFTNTMKH